MSDTLTFASSSGLGTDYPLSIFVPGTFNSNQEVIGLNSIRPFKLRVDCAGSIARLGTAATGSCVFIIKKNGTQVGTFTFAPSGTNASFSMASEQTFNSGDLLSVHAPSSADASAAFLSLGLLGFRI